MGSKTPNKGLALGKDNYSIEKEGRESVWTSLTPSDIF
jgi:hypothetical protein